MADTSLPKYEIKKAAKMGTPKSILIYGPPKKGKSYFAASIVRVPGFERVLFIDVEGGSSAIAEDFPEVDVVEAPTAKAFTSILEDLLNNKLVEPVSGLPYQVVIVDTLDKAQERQLEVYATSPQRFVNGKEDGFFKWAALKTWTAKIGDLLHMAPFLTIWVAHEDDHQDDGGPVLTTVLLNGKSRLTFPSIPDIIGRFTVGKVEVDGVKGDHRLIDFTVSSKLITGQRYGNKLDGKFIDPTMEKIFEKIDPARFS